MLLTVNQAPSSIALFSVHTAVILQESKEYEIGRSGK